MPKRARLLLPVLSVVAAWLAMQAVHELGHVIATLALGGTVDNVDLHPLHISRTDVGLNPNPLVVVWAGPAIGVVLPAAFWLAASALRLRHAFLARFLAGFCLVANGTYIGVGSFDRVGDCGDMLRYGSPIWTLWGFGALCTTAGFIAWHGLADRFGLRASAAPPERGSTVVAGASLASFLALAIFVGP